MHPPRLYEVPKPPRLSGKVAIYVLIRPTDNQIVYVGQSNAPASRFNDHLRVWKEKHSYEPRMFVVEEVSKEVANEREMYWMKQISQSGVFLLNQHVQPKPFSWREGKFKYSLEDLQIAASKHGGACLTTTFEGVNRYYNWQCSQGHQWNASAISIMQGHWCRKCARFRSSQ
ncbi:MAG: GIY-YIG nuclease family protein [Laribacter sp.]|nr:GIY-YIG nuclease family protein [Laribacter sp.]MBP9607838.1 GIY-YIG nuclease family protein [Laribacter sp.]